MWFCTTKCAVTGYFLLALCAGGNLVESRGFFTSARNTYVISYLPCHAALNLFWHISDQDVCAAECRLAMADGRVGCDASALCFRFHELPPDWHPHNSSKPRCSAIALLFHPLYPDPVPPKHASTSDLSSNANLCARNTERYFKPAPGTQLWKPKKYPRHSIISQIPK